MGGLKLSGKKDKYIQVEGKGGCIAFHAIALFRVTNSDCTVLHAAHKNLTGFFNSMHFSDTLSAHHCAKVHLPYFGREGGDLGIWE